MARRTDDLPARTRLAVDNGAMAQRRPQVVAHRGSSATKAEHTLGAYVTALDEGAEALECDVRLTADGHLVCVHDRDLRRTANKHGVVSTMELAELEQLDFASWKQPWADLDDEAPEMDPELGKVLTLRRLLETVADYPRRVELAIETKHPTRYAGLVERRLVEAARRVRLGRCRLAGPGDELLLGRTAPDPPARSRAAARAPDGLTAGLGELAPVRRAGLDRRPGHRAAAQASRADPADPEGGDGRCTCGRSTRAWTWTSASSSTSLP